MSRDYRSTLDPSIFLDYEKFARTFLRIKTKQRRIKRLKFNSAQKILWQTIKKQRDAGLPVRVAVLKARQIGISTFVQGFLFWNVVTIPNTNALAVAHDIDSTQRIFEMSKLFYEYLPVRPVRKYSNRRELVFADEKGGGGLRSRLEIGTAGKIGVGHGMTYQLLHLSEVALWPYPEELIVGLFPTVPFEPGTAIILESTAHGAGDFWHKFWQEAKSGENAFTPVFIPWHVLPEYRFTDEKIIKTWMSHYPLTDEEKELKRRFKLDNGQLAWRRQTIQALGSEDLFRQEYPSDDIEAWIVSGVPVFDTQRLLLAYEKAQDPVRGYLDGHLNFHPAADGFISVWEKPQPGTRYTIGVDVGGGSEGGDASCAQVIKSGVAEQVAEWWGHLEPVQFAREVEKLGRWYNMALVAVEINSMGLATQAELRNRSYWNQFRWRYLDRFTDKLTDKIGWETNLKTKPILVAHMEHRINEGTCLMRGRDLIEEAMHFIQEGAGKAAPGFHDDRIMAFMIAVYTDFLDNPLGATGLVDLTLPDSMQFPPGLDARTHDTGIEREPEYTDWRVL